MHDRFPDFLRAPAPAHAVAHAAGSPLIPLPVDLRWLGPSCDLGAILDVEHAAFPRPPAGHAGPSRRLGYLQLRRLQALPNVTLRAAYAAGRPVGYAMAEHAGRALIVQRIVVHPAARRRGVGRALVGDMMARLCPARRPRLEVRVDERDDEVVRFWKAVGFKAVKVERGYFGEHSDAYLFRFRISPTGRGPWEAPCPPRDREREGG